MALLTPRQSRNYVRILSDGTIRRKVSADTPGAQLRKWKLADGTMGETWEHVYEQVEGQITKVWFSDSQFGPQVSVTVSDGDEEVTLTIGLNSRFADDFMKKLPSVDFAQPVALVPYSFDDDKGKKRSGVTFYQNDEKLANYFYDAEAQEVTNGFPEPAGDEKTSDDWKIYFLSVRKFLRNYITENIIPQFGETSAPQSNSRAAAADPQLAELEAEAASYPDSGDGIAF